MKKPLNVVYGASEQPPLVITALSGVQHVGLMSIYLVYPVLIAKASGSTADVAAAMVSLTLVALAIGTVLQVIPIGPLGSGFLCQPIPTVVYLVPSLVAAKHGGLPLVFGMTIAAGALEMMLSRGLRRLRPMFPPEIAGLVVLLVGIATGVVGLRVTFSGSGQQLAVDLVDLAVATLTLAVMMGLNVWGRGAPRLFCVLIGMTVGYAITAMLGRFNPTDLTVLSAGAVIALPDLGHVSWQFDLALALPFVVASVAATLKVIGNVTTCQKANDAEWVRADMRSISRGVLADGLGTIVAGGLGGSGVNTSTAAVGLASATGVLSRYVAYAVAIILVMLAFLPKLGFLFYIMPRPVAGAALIFGSAFIVVNGLEIMTSRLLDARNILVIGLALIIGLAADIYPALFQGLPEGLRAVFGTSLVLGTLVGLGLNLLFRIGMRKSVTLTLPLGPLNPVPVEEFMEKQGAAWGARRDVIDRAKFNLTQSVETILDGCSPQGPLEIEASFDEFNLDIRVSYPGVPLALPETRPSKEEIIASDEGQRALAGFLLRRLADRVRGTHAGGRSTILFHFDH
jgi:NCS2 family nucleobase:cation symporter-2